MAVSPRTPEPIPSGSDPGEPAGGGRPGLSGGLLAWLIVPAVVAIALAGGAVVLTQTAPAVPVVLLAASPTIVPTPATPPPAPTSSDGIVMPAAAMPAPPATATPDQQALAVLTQLPAVLVTSTSVLPLPTLSPDPPAAPATVAPTAAPTVVVVAAAGAPSATLVPAALAPSSTPATAPPVPAPPPPAVPAPTTSDSGPTDPITGLATAAAQLNRVPLIVMIDNHPAAAPQTGLNSASMVIEALAEGGVTRFESFFLSGDAPTVGPVRSARPYFVEWAYPFKPLYIHCGGSWEAVDLLKEASDILTNVDCFNGNMPFWRSADRAMPHNLYSSTSQLWQMAARKGLTAPAGEPQFLHSPLLPPAQRPDSASVSFVFSGMSRSDVTWVYDRDNDRYLRQQWGAWHRDLATGDVVSARDVVILWTNVWELPGDEKGRMGTDTVGQGTALTMRDGQFEWGYWDRKSPSTPLTILDAKRQPMRFAPGRIWFEVLGIGKKVQIGH